MKIEAALEPQTKGCLGLQKLERQGPCFPQALGGGVALRSPGPPGLRESTALLFHPLSSCNPPVAEKTQRSHLQTLVLFGFVCGRQHTFRQHTSSGLTEYTHRGLPLLIAASRTFWGVH